MDYTVGRPGRIFAARIDHGEDLLNELEELAVKEDIRSAFLFILGATGGASVVTGPRKKSLPPEITKSQFDDARELMGIGNIFWESGKPKVHLHAAAGSSSNFIMGCFREHTEVYMVLEVLIYEIDGISAERRFDGLIGFSPIRFEK